MDKFQNWRGRSFYTLAQTALLMIEENPDDWTDSKKLIDNPPIGFCNMHEYLLFEVTRVVEENNYNIDYERYHNIYALSNREEFEPANIVKFTQEEKLGIVVEDWAIKRWLKEQRKEPIKFFDYTFLNGCELTTNESIYKVRAQIILKEIIKAGLDAMKIPRDAKDTISKTCIESKLGSLTKSTFKKAWQFGLDNKMFRTENHDKHSSKKVV